MDNVRREILDSIDCDHVTATKSGGQFSETGAGSAIRMFQWSPPFLPARVTHWQSAVAAFLFSRVAGWFKPICTPCFRPGFHIARRKQVSHPGGRNGVQYANARLSGLVIHQSHRCIEMACNALEYIFAALLDAPQFALSLPLESVS